MWPRVSKGGEREACRCADEFPYLLRIQPRDSLLSLRLLDGTVEFINQVFGLPFERKVGEVAACEGPWDEQYLLMGVELGKQNVVVPVPGTT